MKTLSQHVILYDEECPMCKIYTKAFIQTGMLPVNGRKPYQDIPNEIGKIIDLQRAVNEIALVNLETREVTYGINSLFKVIGYSIPAFKPLFQFKTFVWLMTKFYAFISFNRKVILPAEVKIELQPSFKIQYRLVYLFITWLATAYILTKYAHILTDFVPLGGPYREYFICGGQMFFQGFIVMLYKRDQLWDYLGNMMTISFSGSILLIPGLVIMRYFDPNPVFAILYFLLVAGLMFLEHIRRSKLLKIGWIMTISWAFYRIIILFTILYL